MVIIVRGYLVILFLFYPHNYKNSKNMVIYSVCRTTLRAKCREDVGIQSSLPYCFFCVMTISATGSTTFSPTITKSHLSQAH